MPQQARLQALERAGVTAEKAPRGITKGDLFSLGLSGGENSASRGHGFAKG